MIGPSFCNLSSPAAWRHIRDSLVNYEAAMGLTEGEIRDRRIARLEAEVASLQAIVGSSEDARLRAAPADSDRPGPHQWNA